MEELEIKELRELKEVIEYIEKAQGLVIYFYLENVEATKNYIKKFRYLKNEIKKINPTSKVLFTKINGEKAIEINEVYEVQNFPCICIYYKQEQKAAFPKR